MCFANIAQANHSPLNCALTVITQHKISPFLILVVEINPRRKTLMRANSFQSALFGEFMCLECKGLCSAYSVWERGAGGILFRSVSNYSPACAAGPLIRVRTL